MLIMGLGRQGLMVISTTGILFYGLYVLQDCLCRCLH